LTEQARSIKDLLNGQSIAPSLGGKTREIPSRQSGPILPPQVANQKADFTSSSLLADSAIIITNSELGQQRIYYMAKERTFSCETNQVF